MRKVFKVAMALGLLCGISACSTVKWVYVDRATGETWWIKHDTLSTTDEISYCTPAGKGPAQCTAARMLDAPPPRS